MPRLTTEQLEARRTFIGASDIGAIAGLNPYRDAVDVLNEKLGFNEEYSENEAAEWGHRLEPVIRSWYLAQLGTGQGLLPCGTVKHATVPWAAATLDSKVIGTRRGLEIKAVGHRMVFDWDPGDDEGVPHYVRCQAAWQMWCIDLDEVDVAALLGGTQARIWRIKRDNELQAMLVTKGEEFWRTNVLEQRAPAITGSDSVRTYLEHKYPPPPAPVMVDADGITTGLVEERERLKAMRDEGESGYRSYTAKLIAWLGERNATDIVGDGWQFRYRVRKDGSRQPWFQRKGEKT